MTNSISIQTNSSIATPADLDPFSRVADRELGVEGSFLKFKAGVWLIGADEEVVKPNARFAALVSEIQHGFVKWVDRKVDSRVMKRVADGPSPSRTELRDNDESAWPLGPKGHEDPWVFTYIVPLISVEENMKVVFTTSSKGGRGAVGKLCREYTQQRRKVPSTQYPIVELGCDSYRHERYHVVQRPLFRIVEWIAESAPTTAAASNVLDDDILF